MSYYSTPIETPDFLDSSEPIENPDCERLDRLDSYYMSRTAQERALALKHWREAVHSSDTAAELTTTEKQTLSWEVERERHFFHEFVRPHGFELELDVLDIDFVRWSDIVVVSYHGEAFGNHDLRGYDMPAVYLAIWSARLRFQESRFGEK